MTNAALQFQDGDRLGRVAAVDTSRVLISVENHQHMTTIAVGNLIAIQGRTAAEFLIGIVERATRSVSEKLLLDETADDGSIPLGESQEDLIKAVLIGTYRTVDGNSSRSSFSLTDRVARSTIPIRNSAAVRPCIAIRFPTAMVVIC